MKDLDLAWDTYEFHASTTANNESDFLKYVGEEANANNLNKLIACSALLINGYTKQNIALKDLIGIHKYHSLNGVPIPIEREVSISTLNELINTNSTLIECLKLQNEEFKSLLG